MNDADGTVWKMVNAHQDPAAKTWADTLMEHSKWDTSEVKGRRNEECVRRYIILATDLEGHSWKSMTHSGFASIMDRSGDVKTLQETDIMFDEGVGKRKMATTDEAEDTPI